MTPTSTAPAAATTDHAATPPASTQLVVLRLGREEYALPIDRVQEIIFWTPPRPVSSDRPWVSGVIALRGKILPVFDLALRLGVPRGDGSARIVVVETGGEPMGVTVDDATEVLTVGAADLEPLPQGTAHDLLRAITKVGDRLIAVLDLSTLATAPAEDARPAGAVAPAVGERGAHGTPVPPAPTAAAAAPRSTTAQQPAPPVGATAPSQPAAAAGADAPADLPAPAPAPASR